MNIYALNSDLFTDPEMDFSTPFAERDKLEAQSLAPSIKDVKDNYTGPFEDIVGEIVRFPHADGYAQYIVANEKDLIHIPFGDAWHSPVAEMCDIHHIKGVILTQQKKEKLFGKFGR